MSDLMYTIQDKTAIYKNSMMIVRVMPVNCSKKEGQRLTKLLCELINKEESAKEAGYL